jgi:hypothetical protein
MKNKAFLNHRKIGNGFRLTFENGNSISTVWGEMTYTDNYDVRFTPDYTTQMLSSDTCECMIDCSNELLDEISNLFPDEIDDRILKYLTLDKWIKLINILSK